MEGESPTLNSKSSIEIKIRGVSGKSSNTETLFEVSIDSELNFENHISYICRKVCRKLSALVCIARNITLLKRRMLLQAFIESQFNDCPLIWMLHSRTVNNKTNPLPERSLRIVYSNQRSTFEVLLQRDKIFSIHHKNIQKLVIEIYKFVDVLSPEIINSVFNLKENNRYSLGNAYEFYSQKPRTVKHGTKSLVFTAKNMVYSTSDHKRKHFHIFLQKKNKEMESRLSMPALQGIFTCWFCTKVNFISLVNPPCEEAYSEPSQIPRMELSGCLMGSCA